MCVTHQQGRNISELLELRGVFFLTQQRGQLVLISHPIDQAGFVEYVLNSIRTAE